MKPTVKFLNGKTGKYEYGTVVDVGDLDKLHTKVKTDLVSAINELKKTGGSGTGGSTTSELEKQLQDMEESFKALREQIDNNGLNQKQQEEIQKIVDKLPKVDYDKINREIDERVETSRELIEEKTLEIEKDMQLTKSEIDQAKDNAEKIKEHLNEVEINTIEIDKKYDDLTGSLKDVVRKTEFDLLEGTLKETTVIVDKNAKELSEKVSETQLNSTNDRVKDLSQEIKANAEEIKSKLTKKEVVEQIDEEFKNSSLYKPNLIRNAREWSGWEASDAKVAIMESDYQHCKIQKQTSPTSFLEGKTETLEQGKTYTLSIWATGSATGDVFANINGKEIKMTSGTDSTITTNWKRYSCSYVADSDTEKAVYFNSDNLQGGELKLSGAKMEAGNKATGFIDNVNDIFAKTTILDSEYRQTAEGLKISNKKIEEHEDSIKKQTGNIEILSDKFNSTYKQVEQVGEKVANHETQIKQNAKELARKLEEADVSKIIGESGIESRNRVKNGNFFDGFSDWTKQEGWSIKKIGGEDCAYIKREGVQKDLISILFSDYIAVSEGQTLSVGLDMFIGDIAKYDTRKPLRIEFYDEKNTRVDFVDYDLDKLLSGAKTGLNSRLSTSYAVTRKDIKKARVGLAIHKNGELGFTNISAKTGKNKDENWSVAPEDTQKIQTKLALEIKETAKGIEGKAEKEEVNLLNKDYQQNKAKWNTSAEKVSTTIEELKRVDKEVSNVKTKQEQTTKDFTTKVTQIETGQSKLSKDLNDKIDNVSVGGRNFFLNSEVVGRDSLYMEKKGNLHEPLCGVEVPEWKTENATQLYADGLVNNEKSLTISSRNSYLSSGEKYVFSIYVRNDSVLPIVIHDSGNGKVELKPKEAKRIVTKSTVEKGGELKFYATINGNSIRLTVWKPKIESGTLLTDWTPAPEDALSESEKNLVQWTDFSIDGDKWETTQSADSKGYIVFENDCAHIVKNEGTWIQTQLYSNVNSESLLNIKNGTYTISADFYVEEMTNRNAGIHLRANKTDKTTENLMVLNVPLDKSYMKRWVRLTRTQYVGSLKDYEFLRLIIVAGGGELVKFKVRNIKIERGAKTTQWRPNPEDLLSKANEAAGRNFLLGTDEDKTLIGSNIVNQGVDMYRFAKPIRQIFKAGDIVVISYDWKASAAGGTITTEINNVPWSLMLPFKTKGTRNNNSNITEINKTSGTVTIWSRLTNETVNSIADMSKIRLDNVPVGNKITFSNTRLTIGEKEYEWSLAPEDVQEKIKKHVNGGVNILSDSNDFSTYVGYKGCSFTVEGGIKVPEWGAIDASRITLDKDGNGTETVKILKQPISGHIPVGDRYTNSIYIKNNGKKSMYYGNNFTREEVKPNESKRVVLDCEGRGYGYLQSRFETVGANDTLDITVWHDQIESGTFVSDWKPSQSTLLKDLNSIATKIYDVEQKVDAKSIVNTITESEYFQDLLDQKANSNELEGMAKEEALEKAMEDIRSEIELSAENVLNKGSEIFIKNSEMKQLVDKIMFSITQTGGVNLLKNSVGYAGTDYWEATAGFSTVQNEELSSLGYGSGWIADGKTKGQINLDQMLSLPAGTYTISYSSKVSKGSCGIRIRFNGTWDFKYVNDSTVNTGGNYIQKSITFTTKGEAVGIRIFATDSSEVTISGVMLNEGSQALSWQPHNTEIYNTNVLIDSAGLRVFNNQTNGYTIVTPDEFAGYAMVAGVMERVFSVNDQVTFVKKLKVGKEVAVGNIKMLHVSNPATKHDGIAFVPNR